MLIFVLLLINRQEVKLCITFINILHQVEKFTLDKPEELRVKEVEEKMEVVTIIVFISFMLYRNMVLKILSTKFYRII